MKAGLVSVFAVLVAFLVEVYGLLELPNTSGIDGQLTANLQVDRFFSLWIVFNNDDVRMSDGSFTIFAPQNSATRHTEGIVQRPEVVKQLLLDHVVLGSLVDLSNVTSELSFKTMGGRTVHVRKVKDGVGGTADGALKANNARVIKHKVEVPHGVLVILDNFLFEDEVLPETSDKNSSQKRLVSEEHKNKEVTHKKQSNTTFVDNVLEVLSYLKSGVRVFQHFLNGSNVSKLLNEGEEYTVFVPTDHAFQRWHPIDWGFYPFSVPEFTESVIINHFVKGWLKQENIKDGQVIKTLGGREVVFKKTPSLTVNGATVVRGDTPVAKGNIMFISEVLFVSESVVSKLHQQNKDKETPPLLAFPWFGAQFLSHAFLALERDKRFTHVTRFLNLADLAPYVSGANYSFFVPIDKAFEELGLDKMPDNYLSNGDGLQILLNHFVKGRLYDRDLKDGTNLVTLGNKTIHIKRKKENITVNDATIVQSQVFVYNLGTMFYIDKVLFTSATSLPSSNIEPVHESSTLVYTTNDYAETIPEEMVGDGDVMPNVLVADETVSTDDSFTTESGDDDTSTHIN